MKILTEVFAIDRRSLAAFRIALSVLILIDLADRARDLTAHYTDLGVLSREALSTLIHDPLNLSLHMLSGHPFWTLSLFVLAAASALLLLFNCWTRAAAIASWILLVSLHRRNPFVLYGGDLFLRTLLFWSVFLPWNRDTKERKGAVVSVASAALLLQVVFVYFFTGLLKAKDSSWLAGQGVYYALALDTHARPLGTWLLGFPKLTFWLSHATLLLELAGPWLLFFTFRSPRSRLAVIACFVVFQASLFCFMSLGLFPWISTAAMIPFLPSLFWDAISRKREPDAGTEILNPPWIIRGFLMISLTLVSFWNIAAVFPPSFTTHALWIWPRIFALNQTWIMFVSPRVTDGWYVIPGTLSDGSEVDLFQGTPGVTWTRPRNLSASYKNLRWNKYMSNVWDLPPLRPHLAWFLCHRWNQKHPGNRLEAFEINYQLELTRPDDPNPPAQKVGLGQYRCNSSSSPRSPRRFSF